MASGTFFNRDTKIAKYSVQIIKKCQGSVRTSCGAIDLGEEVFRRKKVTEWMLIKLRIVYPYGLNEKVGYLWT